MGSSGSELTAIPGLAVRRLCARTTVGFELGGGGGGGLVGLTGQFMLILAMLGDFGGGEGRLDGVTPPARPVASGTGLVGFDSAGGGFGAKFGFPKFKVGGLVGILGGFRLKETLSVESLCENKLSNIYNRVINGRINSHRHKRWFPAGRGRLRRRASVD